MAGSIVVVLATVVVVVVVACASSFADRSHAERTATQARPTAAAIVGARRRALGAARSGLTVRSPTLYVPWATWNATGMADERRTRTARADATPAEEHRHKGPRFAHALSPQRNVCADSADSRSSESRTLTKFRCSPRSHGSWRAVRATPGKGRGKALPAGMCTHFVVVKVAARIPSKRASDRPPGQPARGWNRRRNT